MVLTPEYRDIPDTDLLKVTQAHHGQVAIIPPDRISAEGDINVDRNVRPQFAPHHFPRQPQARMFWPEDLNICIVIKY